MEFAGPLAIMSRLAEIVALATATMGNQRAALPPPDGVQTANAEGDSGHPAVSVTSSGIEVSQSLMVPNIAIGYASLVNIDFGAKFTLPFDDTAPGLELGFGSVSGRSG